MPNLLQKFLAPTPAKTKNARLPALARQNRPMGGAAANQSLPPAAIVYGIAAAALFAVSLCFLFAGSWFTALLVLLPARLFSWICDAFRENRVIDDR